MLLNDALGCRSADGAINPEDWISPDLSVQTSVVEGGAPLPPS
jgi:hypothetical protein